MKLRSALLAATMLAIPFAANAQPVTGLYIGAGVGVNVTQQEQVKNLSFPTLAPGGSGISASGNLKGSAGFVGLASIGWGFGNGLRAEIEGNYRQNSLPGFTGFSSTAGRIAGGSTQQEYGGMLNVLYDFNGLSPWIVPYVGAGVGGIWAAEKLHAYNGFGFTSGATTVQPGALNFRSDETSASFAYQAILGAAIPIVSMPGLAITAEYRFMGTAGTRDYNGVASLGAVKTSATAQLGSIYNHSFLVGLRYNFGVAPPPPPPPAAVPAQAPARSYLVFFDWDKANLTDRARQIIKEAADNSTHVQYTRIEVNGYTDTSGTPQYNMGLSIRRANAVKAELIKDGVPVNAITTQGFGETHLLVPTGPGVREPQNRRVEIIIR
jgi:outer membrane protein OmpA-like peptidoglycan-associated protein